jgi:predicted esterase
MSRPFRAVVCVVLVGTACCSGTDEPSQRPGLSNTSDSGVSSPDAANASPEAAPPDAPSAKDADPGDTSVQGDASPMAPRDVRCGDPVPPGAELAPSLPSYSGAACPVLTPGRNKLLTGGVEREFLLVVPQGYDSSTERLPLVFMWHFLGGNAEDMLTKGEAQDSADHLRFIAAIPESQGDLAIAVPVVNEEFDPEWPFLLNASQERFERELLFFDDMLACIGAQLLVDESCVSSVGVSAGALWTAQLIQHRGERLASAILISGGVGPATTGIGSMLGLEVRGWGGVAHRMPIMVGWGGPTDQCGINFETASLNLESHLDGHYVTECVHNCGHAMPPVDTMAGLRALWGFALDHPYWLTDGESPYLVRGLPSDTPGWCAMGMGSATPRVGACEWPDADSDGKGCPIPAL